jgi:hypothetical protein
MLIESWPLDLFWILSLATIVFAAAAYVIGEAFDRRHLKRHKRATEASSVAPEGRGSS